MSYRVIAPLVVAPDEDGNLHYHYEGAEVESIDAAAASRLVKEGLLEKVKATRAPAKAAAKSKSAGADSGKTGDAATPNGDALPPFTAPDEDWIVYAVTQGLDEAEARALGKTELIAKFAQQ